jgi:ribosomal-protein-serine acetyltransferase
MEPNPQHRVPGVIDAGAGVALCPVIPGDAPELYAAIDRNRVRLRQWLPWLAEGYELADARRFLEESFRDNSLGLSFTTIIREHGEFRGAIGLHAIDPLNRASSIGYWIDSAAEGRGIATRACRAIVNSGFQDFCLHRIEIRCAAGNQRSAAIPIRLGFREEGLLREAEWLYDHWVDLRVFSALHREWAKVSGTGT